MFKQNDYVKVVDSHGNYRFGFVQSSRDKGDLLLVDLCDEGASKIGWDEEFSKNNPDFMYDVTGKSVTNLKKSFTETEKTLVLLLSQVMSYNQIAKSMNISPVTVRSHIRFLKSKLQVETKEQLIVYCQGLTNGKL